MPEQLPIQPVEKPIICNPYNPPKDHWVYDSRTGEASHAGMRRPAGYWYKTVRMAAGQTGLFTEEERDDLTLVNLLREDVGRWRDAEYRGASPVSRELLRYWARPDRYPRLFFCQREAAETIIYLAELRFPGKSSRTGFQKFSVTDEDLAKLLRGERPPFALAHSDFFPTLIDKPADNSSLPLRRLGCKMATGSGKTVLMAMLIAWAFCNRGENPQSAEFPNAVLVCCPNTIVKERLQVLRPDLSGNYYCEFDLVPVKYRPHLQRGKVLIENWHRFNPESEHKEGDKTYAVVNKGDETPETLARRVLGDLYERMPIMVLNDEGHHCWRPAAAAVIDRRGELFENGGHRPPLQQVDRGGELFENVGYRPPLQQVSAEERKGIEEELSEARVWLDGLDRVNNANSAEKGKPGISMCVDLSATPFYLKGSGYPEGSPFPWLVSDFGLVDAIESGIVKIPRLPVLDSTGRPDPKYFKLWEKIKESLEPAEFLPGGRPKPDVVYREAEGALQQMAGQWVERFNYINQAAPGQERVPPVMIIVCDNTDIAEVFYRKISGESEEEIVTQAEVEEVLAEENGDGELESGKKVGKAKKPKTRTVYGEGVVYPKYFSNTPGEKRTIRIDTRLLAEAESEDPNKRRREVALELRRVVATVGKPGQPGEHVRCVVSVAMLNEGWDANNVTHILGVRAFGSQLLCEQVVGRGLRRMDYTPDPETGLLTEEYADVYGIPFSVIPFKGRPVKKTEPDDRPKNHVRALTERSLMEIRFPVVEGYAFALRRNLIKCDVGEMELLILEPNREPTATFLMPTVGYKEGHPSQQAATFEFVEQSRETYYKETHIQAIKFQITRLIIERLLSAYQDGTDAKSRVLRLQSRHQLFPQVYRYVEDYVGRKVDFQGCHQCELGLEKYIMRMVERLADQIMPDDAEGEPPLMPVLNRYKPIGTTEGVNFKTVRPCFPTQRSHINQVVSDTATWESSAAFRIEQAHLIYARNDHMGLFIPYEYQGVDHNYEPDYMVRLAPGVTLVLEIKGFEDDEVKAKHNAARRWVSAVNNWGQLGKWKFHVCRNPQVLGKELAFLISQLNHGVV